MIAQPGGLNAQSRLGNRIGQSHTTIAQSGLSNSIGQLGAGIGQFHCPILLPNLEPRLGNALPNLLPNNCFGLRNVLPNPLPNNCFGLRNVLPNRSFYANLGLLNQLSRTTALGRALGLPPGPLRTVWLPALLPGPLPLAPLSVAQPTWARLGPARFNSARVSPVTVGPKFPRKIQKIQKPKKSKKSKNPKAPNNCTYTNCQKNLKL